MAYLCYDEWKICSSYEAMKINKYVETSKDSVPTIRNHKSFVTVLYKQKYIIQVELSI